MSASHVLWGQKRDALCSLLPWFLKFRRDCVYLIMQIFETLLPCKFKVFTHKESQYKPLDITNIQLEQNKSCKLYPILQCSHT